MVWKLLYKHQINKSKRPWLAYVVPKNLISVACEFDPDGKLIDFEALAKHDDGTTYLLDTHNFDRHECEALGHECREFGTDVS